VLFYEDIEKFYLVFQFTFFVESDDHFDLLDELAAEPNYISYPLKKISGYTFVSFYRCTMIVHL